MPLFRKSRANRNLSNARRMLNGMSSDALFRPCAIPTTEYTKNSKIFVDATMKESLTANMQRKQSNSCLPPKAQNPTIMFNLMKVEPSNLFRSAASFNTYKITLINPNRAIDEMVKLTGNDTNPIPCVKLNINSDVLKMRLPNVKMTKNDR